MITKNQMYMVGSVALARDLNIPTINSSKPWPKFP